MIKDEIILSFKKTYNSIKIAVPIIIGVFLLISLISPIMEDYYSIIFTNNYFLDPLIGAILGSISFGIPITSYIAGGELLKQGVSLLAISAFMLAWTTVGVAMLPLEIKYLGKKFAIIRNGINFILSIIISILTIITLRSLGL